MNQGKAGFRHAHELHCPRRGFSRQQAQRIGHPNVFTGENDHATSEKTRAFSGFEKSHEPVHRGIGVGTPHGLDEGADLVVVRVGRLPEMTSVPSERNVFSPNISRGERPRDIQSGEKVPSVTG